MKEGRYNHRQGRGARPRALYTLFLGSLLGLYLLSSCSTAPLRRPRSFRPPRERARIEIGAFAQELQQSLRRQRSALLREVPGLGAGAHRVIFVPTLRFKEEISKYEYYTKLRRQPYFHTWEEFFALLDTRSFKRVAVFVEQEDERWYTCDLANPRRRLIPIDSVERCFLEELLGRGEPLAFRSIQEGYRCYFIRAGQLEVYRSPRDRMVPPSEVLPEVVQIYSKLAPVHLRGRSYKQMQWLGKRLLR